MDQNAEQVSKNIFLKAVWFSMGNRFSGSLIGKIIDPQ
jgi:hypothetical protein